MICEGTAMNDTKATTRSHLHKKDVQMSNDKDDFVSMRSMMSLTCIRDSAMDLSHELRMEASLSNSMTPSTWSMVALSLFSWIMTRAKSSACVSLTPSSLLSSSTRMFLYNWAA